MKILIIGPSVRGGGLERMMAYRAFLLSQNHVVHLIQLPGSGYMSKAWYYYQRARARLQGHEKRHMKKTADKLAKTIKKEEYDVVIGVETSWSYVLTRELDALKIFSCEAPEADQLYFSGKPVDLERVRCWKEMEIEIMQKSDHVVFPWKTTENYVRRYVWNGNNFSTLKFGCYPQKKTASYFFPVSIVSLGSLWGTWTNKELLSQLTRTSPYAIDVFGVYRPPKKYRLNYKGFAATTDVLCNYQFGLNVVSKDILRRNHFSSRSLGYLAYGLPVLSPDWMEFSHELKGSLPFNEDNFLEVLEKYSDRDEWEKLSKEAHEQALQLDWKNVLKPLEKIVATR